MIWPSFDAQLTNFVVIQTYLSRHFYLTVDPRNLRRNGPSSKVTDPLLRDRQ